MEDKFYNLALRFLSYRPRSEKEVRDRLKFKIQPFGFAQGESSKFKVDEDIIEKIIAKLKKQKFIDDEEFARGWIEQRSTFKPRSMKLIKLELKHKGIGNEMVDRIIHNSEFIIQNDLEQAKRLAEKRMIRFRNKVGMTREEIYQKLGRYLASKGFDWDTIKKSIDPVKS